jgi:hypothetical protein
MSMTHRLQNAARRERSRFVFCGCKRGELAGCSGIAESVERNAVAAKILLGQQQRVELKRLVRPAIGLDGHPDSSYVIGNR